MPKYDVAISTSVGGLDYIVIETSAAAQACMDMLRKNTLGVATFMIMKKQTNHMPTMKEKVSTPKGIPRHFDLIKVQDERMKSAFYAAMRNTVVAKDIDQVRYLDLNTQRVETYLEISWRLDERTCTTLYVQIRDKQLKSGEDFVRALEVPLTGILSVLSFCESYRLKDHDEGA
ncbi:structural maintenance of chromosomes protein 4 [Tanacetum coccineum]